MHSSKSDIMLINTCLKTKSNIIMIVLKKQMFSKENNTFGNDKFSLRTVSDECCQSKCQNSILQFPLKHQLL